MEPKFKYGLSNANAFLKRFRQQKSAQLQEEDNQTVQEKTFQEQQFQTSTFVNNNHKKLSHIKSIDIQKQKQIGLSQLVIKQHLKQTLKVYEKDLEQLQENKQILVQAIQQLAAKIQGLSDIHTKNQILELDNFKQKKQIENSYKDYSALKLQIIQKKLKSQAKFRKQQQRLKTLLQIMPLDVENAVSVDSWKQYYSQIKYSKNKSYLQIDQRKIIDTLFPKKTKNQNNKSKQPKKGNFQKEGLLGDLKSFAKNFKMP